MRTYFCFEKDIFAIRLGKYCFKIKNKNRYPLLFSERNKYFKGLGFSIGNIYFKIEQL